MRSYELVYVWLTVTASLPFEGKKPVKCLFRQLVNLPARSHSVPLMLNVKQGSCFENISFRVLGLTWFGVADLL